MVKCFHSLEGGLHPQSIKQTSKQPIDQWAPGVNFWSCGAHPMSPRPLILILCLFPGQWKVTQPGYCNPASQPVQPARPAGLPVTIFDPNSWLQFLTRIPVTIARLLSTGQQVKRCSSLLSACQCVVSQNGLGPPQLGDLNSVGPLYSFGNFSVWHVEALTD